MVHSHSLGSPSATGNIALTETTRQKRYACLTSVIDCQFLRDYPNRPFLTARDGLRISAGTDGNTGPTRAL